MLLCTVILLLLTIVLSCDLLHIDKEVHLRMHVHQQDNFDVKARRRQSVPSSVLEKELVNFQIGESCFEHKRVLHAF